MEYWNSLLTEKSWNVLKKLAASRLDFVLIGGWAAYLWTKLQKSEDVDIVLESISDLETLKSGENLTKNESLRKYEIHYDEIDVDVYVPYYSKLAIPPEEISKYSAMREGLKLATPEALCILKQGAEEMRSHSVKGVKDRIDIMTLLCNTDFDYREYAKLAEKYGHAGYPSKLRRIVTSFREGKYLGYNPRELRLKKEDIANKLRVI